MMLELTLENRVAELEDLMTDLLRAQARTQRNLDQLAQETRTYRRETRNDLRDMKKKWGELANKMGTMAEDMVAPSVPHILRTVTGYSEQEIDLRAVRMRRRHSTDPGRSQEFDVVAACGEYVLINETKSRLDTRDVDDFVSLLAEVRGFFPEYADRHFIGAIASLYVDESLVRYGEKQGSIVLGFGTDVMGVLNSPGFEPKKF